MLYKAGFTTAIQDDFFMSRLRRNIPDLGPDVYTKWRMSELGATTERLELDLVLELVGNVQGLRVLDLGCGDGLLAVTLQNLGAEVVGLDASWQMVAAARERAVREQSEIGLCVGLAEDLPFAEDSFDIVVAVTILCFVEEAELTFREIGRVLHSEGRLVIGELGRFSTWAARRRIKAWFGSPIWRQGHFRTSRELQRLACIGGLVPGTVRGAIYYPHSNWGARYLARFDQWFGNRSTTGAAFLALSADKPPRRSSLSAEHTVAS